MTGVGHLFMWLWKRKHIVFADDTRTSSERKAINAFLQDVLSPEERENIENYFLSDEATIFDCSMDTPATWVANCKAAYNLDISNRLHMPLWELVTWLGKQAVYENSAK